MIRRTPAYIAACIRKLSPCPAVVLHAYSQRKGMPDSAPMRPKLNPGHAEDNKIL